MVQFDQCLDCHEHTKHAVYWSTNSNHDDEPVMNQTRCQRSIYEDYQVNFMLCIMISYRIDLKFVIWMEFGELNH